MIEIGNKYKRIGWPSLVVMLTNIDGEVVHYKIISNDGTYLINYILTNTKFSFSEMYEEINAIEEIEEIEEEIDVEF